MLIWNNRDFYLRKVLNILEEWGIVFIYFSFRKLYYMFVVLKNGLFLVLYNYKFENVFIFVFFKFIVEGEWKGMNKKNYYYKVDYYRCVGLQCQGWGILGSQWVIDNFKVEVDLGLVLKNEQIIWQVESKGGKGFLKMCCELKYVSGVV